MLRYGGMQLTERVEFEGWEDVEYVKARECVSLAGLQVDATQGQKIMKIASTGFVPGSLMQRLTLMAEPREMAVSLI